MTACLTSCAPPTDGLSQPKIWILAIAWLAMVPGAHAAAAVPAIVPAAGELDRSISPADAAAFRQPPRIFHPETWFHFIGGNVAPQGITADLEAIASAGIQGVQLFHGQFGGPWPGVAPQIKCLSAPWDGAVHQVGAECQRLGLRFTMQNCPGWAMAGGPWITPDKAMRHLVWSHANLTGGKRVEVALSQPPPSKEEWRDYHEVAVVAFPTPEGDSGQALVPDSIKSNREDLPWDKCLRNEPGGKITLEPGREPVWVEATFKHNVTLRTVELPSVQSFNHHWCYQPDVTLTVQAVLADGLHQVASHSLPASNWQGNRPISLACSDEPARTFRITISHQHPLTLSCLQLFAAARMNNWEAEAAWVLGALDRAPLPVQSKAAWIDPSMIVDLTGQMDAAGTLHWDAPPGNWTVTRWGHVNTGRRNGPAPPEGTGWECDKLSPAGAEAHYAGYIGRLAAKKGPVGGGLLQGMLLDSWECETQTWTPGMDQQFAQLRGYPLRVWLPALAGYVVGDPTTTTRFLRDWRATINELVVHNFFGRMAQLAHRDGLSISHETAAGDVFPGDILEYYKYADVPMCEFWQPRMESHVGSFNFKPVKPCVSAARMYGKPRVAAEAFTSFNLTWNEHPGMLKHIADMHLAEGVTHLVFHTYTHNPRTDGLPPGTAFGSGIGTPFLRGQTWWPHMPEFTDYLARCGFLLERGRPVSDVLWYLGDEQDHKPPQDAAFPTGYHSDYCNPDALLTRLAVRDGMIVTPEGLRYRLLWLRDCPRMLPETLERMLAFVQQGAVLVGDRPRCGIATLSGGSGAELRFRHAVEELWGKDNTASGLRRVGQGRVISGVALGEALTQLDIAPDLRGHGVVWMHRQTDEADWYFVAAPSSNGFRGALGFRAIGTAELWNPLTGAVTPAAIMRRDGATSFVALDLPPSGSVFVMFRKSAPGTSHHVVRLEHDGNVVADAQAQPLTAGAGAPLTPVERLTNPRPPCELLDDGNRLLAWTPGRFRLTRENGKSSTYETRAPRDLPLSGPWKLAFPAGWGAPSSMPLAKLTSWTDLELPAEARAFSGTASYTTDFTLDPPAAADSPVELDLGRVAVIASARLNGVPVGSVWTPPFRLDISHALKPGVNHLSVEVTNTWFNRLTFDAGRDETARKTWTINGPAKGSALQPSGLLGPVTVRIGQTLRTSTAPEKGTDPLEGNPSTLGEKRRSLAP